MSPRIGIVGAGPGGLSPSLLWSAVTTHIVEPTPG